MDKLRSKAGEAFDLPTEAQWEYACRAGTTLAYNDYTKNGGAGSDCLTTGSGQDTNLDPLARYRYNGYSAGKQHADAGSYQGNFWGLYDMHGNVYEWCVDWYAAYAGNVSDPMGSTTGSDRVLRGGYWFDYAQSCRSASRNYYSPGFASDSLGFRLALPPGR